MKKTLLRIAAVLLALLLVLTAFASCGEGAQGAAGKDGAKGKDGADGKNGKSAYDLAVENGYVGTVEQWLASLIGAQGEKGDKGDTGSVGAQGEKGDKGDAGVAGVNGFNGSNGKSAYDLAVENGFEGTVEQWLASLKGDKGDTGAAGATGATGATGAAGATGVGITDISIAYEIDEFGSWWTVFTITYSNNTTDTIRIEAPKPVAWDGETIDTTWYSADKTEYIITKADQLAGIAALVNEGTNFTGKTVKLCADIDLGNKEWTPIGSTTENTFKGIFDGNGYTISNLKISDAEMVGAGLFGFVRPLETGTPAIKNVTVVNADITAKHYVGTVVAHLYGQVTGCSVKNVTINCVDSSAEDGDKAGAIVGYAHCEGVATVITDNRAENVSITANRDAGVIVGCAHTSVVVSDNIYMGKNVTVTHCGYGSGENIGGEIGRTL